jgi:mannose-1-phosphate guanylyltransferase/mannose-6-phosphate isomerase
MEAVMTKYFKEHFEVQPVILCGGSGSRLWPLSNKNTPKQFLKLGSKKSLIQEAVGLVTQRKRYRSPMLVSSDKYESTLKEHLEEIGITPFASIFEPDKRNTAPAIALAALTIASFNPDCPMLVMPSDHKIENPSMLHMAVDEAYAAVELGAIATFGIKPTSPETGYGYIKRGQIPIHNERCFNVSRFVEKPDKKTAVKYIKDGSFLWNSGIFMFTAKTFLRELEMYSPEVLAACKKALEKAKNNGSDIYPDKEEYSKAENISVDYAVMEKSTDIKVIETSFNWSDVGSWISVSEMFSADNMGNSAQGSVVLDNCSNIHAHSSKRIIAAIDVDNLVIVETDDAVLVARKDKAQNVREIAQKVLAYNNIDYAAE